VITYIQGDAMKPAKRGNVVIAHVCNDIGAWGRGFVLALSRRWPAAEQDYKHWHGSPPGYPPFKLGQVRCIEVEPNMWVANMIAQRGLRNARNPVPLQYDALKDCLHALVHVGADSVHMPRIGCGLAGGEWSKVERIIEDELCGIPTYVYDLPSSNSVQGSDQDL